MAFPTLRHACFCVMRLASVAAWAFFASIASASFAPASAQSGPASSNLVSAPLVTPANAWTFYGSSTTHSDSSAAWTQSPPEIAALARSLGANRLPAVQYTQNVFDYVRNNIAVEFRFELGKGARGAVIDQSGTPFDQAELMINLLRAGGITANYQVGTITITAQQFGRWTGLIKNLNAGAQTFDVDAAGACQLLADGGIPALVNGAATCAGLTGNLSSVTMGHVWVAANGNLYDPSYKPQIFGAGIDLAAAMSCGTSAAPTCGSSLRTAALTGSSTGNYAAGAPYRQNLNETAALSEAALRATNLQNAIIAANRFATLVDVIGGGVLDLSYAPAVAPTLPYPSTLQFTWTGDVPDTFRVQVQLPNTCAITNVFGDEISGRRLRIYGLTLYADNILLQTCTSGSGSPTFVINHPYAANSGAYADQTAPIVPGAGLAILQFGEATESASDFFGRITIAAPTYFSGQTGGTGCNDPAAQERVGNACRRDHLPQLSSGILYQQSALTQIVEAVNRSNITHHHRVGNIQIKNPGPGGDATVEDRISIQGLVSVQSSVANETARQAAFRSWAHVSSVAEGSVPQQLNDLWFPQSGALTFVHANRGQRRLIYAPPAAMPAVIVGLTQTGPGDPPLYTPSQISALSSFASAGYDVILPDGGATCIPPQGAGCPVTPQLVWRPDSLALLVGTVYKGAGSFDPTQTNGGTQPPTHRSDRQVRGAVEGAAGDFVLRPLPDIVTGVGPFPYSLPFQRAYNSARDTRETSGNVIIFQWSGQTVWNYVGPDAASYARIGGGWTHNYQITARLGSDARRALGAESALEASGTIAGVFALNNLLQNPGFEDWLASFYADFWISQQLFNNAVTVQRDNGEFEFVRLPGGTFNPPAGAPDRLVQTGASTQDWIGYINPINNYRNVSFDLTGADGSVIHFVWAAETGRFPTATVALPIFRATQWTFPSGVRVNFIYSLITGFKFDDSSSAPSGRSPFNRYVLTGVTNSLGRSLTFTLQDSGVQFGGDIGWRINAVTDDSSRQVAIARSNCPPFFANNGGGNPLNTSQSSSLRAQAFFNCETLTVTAPDGSQTRYDYTAGAFSPDPSFLTRANYRLRRWYSPRNVSTPTQTVAYDDLFQTRLITDALNRSSQHFASGVAGSERHKRVEIIDAAGAATLSSFDQFNNLLSITNPLGHTSRFEYDTANRPVRTFNPEGDSVETLYDIRSNVLQVIQRPKPGSSLSPIQVSTSYAEGPTVFACSNAATCNRPVTEDGPRTDVTDITNYTWSSTYGDLTQVLHPADSAGLRPQIDFGYGLFGTGNQFRLPTSRTERVSVSQNLITAYGYNASNRFVLQSVTIDPAGLAIATNLTYNSIGDVTSINGPRQDVSDITNYVWDANRRLIRRIDPQPETSSSTRPALRFTYALDGLVTTEERGSTTVADGSVFTTLETFTHLYDDAGNRIRVTAPAAVTQFSFDAVDRPTCTALRMNPAVYGTLPSDACTLSTPGTFGSDRIVRLTYDSAGQLITEQLAFGTVFQQTFATYSYTPNGQRSSLVDANNNRSSYVYDGFDRLAELHFPVSTLGANQSSPTDFEAYGYDAAGNRTSVRLRSSETVTYSYDALNRETLKDIPNSSSADVYSAYDLVGHRLSARYGSAGGQGVDYTFDVAGRRLSETTFGRALTFAHDAAGNRTRITWPRMASSWSIGTILSIALISLARMARLPARTFWPTTRMTSCRDGRLSPEEMERSQRTPTIAHPALAV